MSGTQSPLPTFPTQTRAWGVWEKWKQRRMDTWEVSSGLVATSKEKQGIVLKEMATHPSILAWRIPWTEEPGGLRSVRPHRVGPEWMTEHTQLQKWIRALDLRSFEKNVNKAFILDSYHCFPHEWLPELGVEKGEVAVCLNPPGDCGDEGGEVILMPKFWRQEGVSWPALATGGPKWPLSSLLLWLQQRLLPAPLPAAPCPPNTPVSIMASGAGEETAQICYFRTGRRGRR